MKARTVSRQGVEYEVGLRAALKRLSVWAVLALVMGVAGTLTALLGAVLVGVLLMGWALLFGVLSLRE